jgi:U3 small nucleolar RNA-associated protein 10
MATSLSQQLKKLAAPQTQIYADDRKRPSLLFAADKAAEIDRETALALGRELYYFLSKLRGFSGIEGLEQLVEIDSSFGNARETLFSDVSASVHRSMLTKDDNEQLSQTVRTFLYRLSPFFLLQPAQKAIEWLIYRLGFKFFFRRLNKTRFSDMTSPITNAI